MDVIVPEGEVLVVADVVRAGVRNRFDLDQPRVEGIGSVRVYLYLIPLRSSQRRAKTHKVYRVGIGNSRRASHTRNLVVVLVADEGDHHLRFVGACVQGLGPDDAQEVSGSQP